MEITLHKIKVRDLVAGYCDKGDEGVYGYDGKLDIRPPYQREFVYDQQDRLLVIDSIMHGFPLNAMYWIAHDDGGYEVMDGQQRTISICQYFNNDFSYEERYFGRLDGTEDARQKKFLEEGREPAIKQVKMDLAIAQIIEQENLEATAEEIEEEYKKLSGYYGMDVDMVKKYLGENEVRTQILNTKAVAVVVDNAKPEKAKKAAKKSEDKDEVTEEKAEKKAKKHAKKAEDGEEKPAKKPAAKKAAKKAE